MNEYEKCDLCKKEEYSIFFSGNDLLSGLGGEFQVVKCKNCGLLRQNPRLDWSSLINYYLDNYISHHPQASEEKNILKRYIRRYGVWKKVKLIRKYKKHGNLFDIGCGTGLFLEEAKRYGNWSLIGLEPNIKAANYASQKLKLPVINNRFEEFEEISQEFDIVTMWDVLEHLYYPLESFRKVNRLLKTNGIFVFSIPNLDSWDRKLFKSSWCGYDLPRHLYFFDSGNLEKFIESSGFQILGSFNVSGSFDSIKNDIYFFNQKHQNIFSILLLNFYDNIFMKLVLLIPLWFLDKFKVNPVITYIVSKK